MKNLTNSRRRTGAKLQLKRKKKERKENYEQKETNKNK